jgi:RHS repeat-associated protein
VYDGDGRRVKSIVNGNTTTYFVGTHYEVTGSTITKYYYAGSQRIAMRTNGTLNYLLGDHLGSTSLTTNANGQVVSELSYTAWGEVRYASGNTPTKYSFTGQFSYVNDFGLMFYNARWLDVSLGRFAQADSIIPGGIQGYDRYAYVNNSPIMFTDPSGHKCMPEDGCSGIRYPRPAQQPPLTENGKKIRDLYLYYASHLDGAWNSNGGQFTLADFVAWILMIESNGDNTLLGYNMQVFSRQLWGTRIDAQGNATPTPYCPSRPCTNGIFNFVGAYSQSAMGRYNALQEGDFYSVEEPPPSYDESYTIESIGRDVVTNPKWTDYNNNVPVHSGNYKENVFGPSWVTNMCNDTPMFTNARDGIVYKFEGENGWFVVVFTINQAAYWSNHRSGMCGQ